jgi:hypothetical protein
MNSSVVCDVEDSEPLPPPKPVVVGDMVYLYRRDPNYDRELDEIDWENLAFDEDDPSEPVAYDSRDYATEEEAKAALEKLGKECLEEARRNARAARKADESR